MPIIKLELCILNSLMYKSELVLKEWFITHAQRRRHDMACIRVVISFNLSEFYTYKTQFSKQNIKILQTKWRVGNIEYIVNKISIINKHKRCGCFRYYYSEYLLWTHNFAVLFYSSLVESCVCLHFESCWLLCYVDRWMVYVYEFKRFKVS